MPHHAMHAWATQDTTEARKHRHHVLGSTSLLGGRPHELTQLDERISECKKRLQTLEVESMLAEVAALAAKSVENMSADELADFRTRQLKPMQTNATKFLAARHSLHTGGLFTPKQAEMVMLKRRIAEVAAMEEDLREGRKRDAAKAAEKRRQEQVAAMVAEVKGCLAAPAMVNRGRGQSLDEMSPFELREHHATVLLPLLKRALPYLGENHTVITELRSLCDEVAHLASSKAEAQRTKEVGDRLEAVGVKATVELDAMSDQEMRTYVRDARNMVTESVAYLRPRLNWREGSAEHQPAMVALKANLDEAAERLHESDVAVVLAECAAAVEKDPEMMNSVDVAILTTYRESLEEQLARATSELLEHHAMHAWATRDRTEARKHRHPVLGSTSLLGGRPHELTQLDERISECKKRLQTLEVESMLAEVAALTARPIDRMSADELADFRTRQLEPMQTKAMMLLAACHFLPTSSVCSRVFSCIGLTSCLFAPEQAEMVMLKRRIAEVKDRERELLKNAAGTQFAMPTVKSADAAASGGGARGV